MNERSDFQPVDESERISDVERAEIMARAGKPHRDKAVDVESTVRKNQELGLDDHNLGRVRDAETALAKIKEESAGAEFDADKVPVGELQATYETVKSETELLDAEKNRLLTARDQAEKIGDDQRYRELAGKLDSLQPKRERMHTFRSALWKRLQNYQAGV